MSQAVVADVVAAGKCDAGAEAARSDRADLRRKSGSGGAATVYEKVWTRAQPSRRSN
ncbi:hypothetical protein PF005_g28971 [Phytophthora fragariae]|uniref:Uncharacterized protein n=1 Tax=Phytophthora fragariae TaxID=53985 RepID=A0A6A3QDM8_9STRA|nr:hypothetical protein PF003_g38858 [Phytophthora fragariae]KAE8920246.1 hypothetical protein PF009_g29457 [Phytophthora fragariae]KAE9063583.1 hypothetical protein PF010_g28937 [Phytophthora fragariae]KAE9067188.1 hypothetical protein PF007_g28166 [Phytophthora fragariae]KAE9073851.1 hypothetical protein PF006_g28646 [Phytophthora fragariae]